MDIVCRKDAAKLRRSFYVLRQGIVKTIGGSPLLYIMRYEVPFHFEFKVRFFY